MSPDRFQYDLFRVLALPIILVLVWLLVQSLRPDQRKRPAGRAFFFFIFGTIGYIFTNTMEICSTTEAASMAWSKVLYVFVAFLPILWLEFSLRFTRQGKGLPFYLLGVATLLPLTTLAILFLPSLHYLMWPEIVWYRQGPFMVSVRSHGPWFFTYAAYTYFFFITGALVVLRSLVLYRRYYRRQAGPLVAGIALPLLVSLVYVLRPFPGLVKDFSSFGYAAAALCFWLALFRRDLFALAPQARSLVVERMRDGIIVLDSGSLIADANPRGLSILGLGEDALGRGLPTESLPPELIEAIHLRQGSQFFLDGPEGRKYYSSEALELGGRSDALLIVLHDETESRALLAKVEELASTDELTRLPNRRSFLECAQREVSRASRHGGHLAVAMFDLDRFKTINDTFGHAIGDRVLREFGRILGAEIRAEDVAGRMGGEEFALVIAGGEGALKLCERVRERVASTQVFTPSGEAISFTASAGVAWLTEGSSDLDSLLSRADLALYKAKAEGRNRVLPWTKEA